MEHDLKTWPVSFEAVLDGRKRYEIRRADRAFAVGDTLLLREWRPAHEGGCRFEGDLEQAALIVKRCAMCKRRIGESLPGEYTGRELRVRATYLTPENVFGVPEGYVLLGIETLDRENWKARAEHAEALVEKIRTRLTTYEGDVNLLVLMGEITAMVGGKISERAIERRAAAYLAARDAHHPSGTRCQERESGGVQCEREEGHEGPHACPDALARFEAGRRKLDTEVGTEVDTEDKAP